MARPRKQKPRDASGKILRQKATIIARDNHSHGLFLRRHLLRIGVPADRLLDPLCGDPLGILRIIGHLTERLYQAGVRYRDTAMLYRRFNGLTSGLPKSHKGVSNSQAAMETFEAVKRRYLGYRFLVQRYAGSEALRAVHEVCVGERMVNEIGSLQRGLNVLANSGKFSALATQGLPRPRLGA